MESPIQKKTISEVEKIFNIFKNSGCDIRPHSIITGPSGSGKSNAIATLCAKLKLKFIELNAASMTKEGTAGASLSKLLSPLLAMGGLPLVVFVDEFDKLFISGNNNSSLAHETTNGVQNEFLKLLEAESASVFQDYGKYVSVPTSNILFMFAGTFNGEPNIGIDRLREFGIKTEFLGRITSVYSLPKLEVSDLHTIVDESPLLDSYIKLFPNANKKKCIKLINGHIEDVYENNTLGARLVNNLIHKYFITGGLSKDSIKQASFQKTMELTPEEEFTPKE
jgi:ATP-dependent protease Clp ATPase subunit